MCGLLIDLMSWILWAPDVVMCPVLRPVLPPSGTWFGPVYPHPTADVTLLAPSGIGLFTYSPQEAPDLAPVLNSSVR